MKNKLNKIILSALLLGVNTLNAQISAGSSGMTVKSGTIVSSQGLVLTPSADLTFSNNELNVSSTPVTIGADNSINRLYTLASPITYSGTLGIKYLSGELNGNSEAAMQIATSALVSGTSWTVPYGSNTGAASSYDVSNTFSGATIGRVTAINPSPPEIDAAYCGTTLEYLNTEYIPAVPVSGAEEYEFRITNGAYTATATDNLQAGKVRIIQFAGYEYNTTYQIDVRVKVGGVWSDYGPACSITTTAAPHSEIDAAQCATTLAAMNTNIYSTTVNGATQYRFRIINGADVQTIDRSVRSFNMTMLASYEYNTTYTIDVAVEFDGVWQPYSTACNITTPTLGTSTVIPTQCGGTLAAATSSIFASAVAGATQYRFRVTNGAEVQTIEKSVPNFKLTELATYAFSTAYTIDVAVEYGGMWQSYGTSCTVSTPAIALTQIQASQCGASLASMTTYIYASSVSGATAYRFRFTEGANVQTYTSATRAMNVTMLASHKANTMYSVEVAAQLNGTWGAYGSACNVTTPSVPTKIQSSQCGTTLPKVDKLIYADAVNLATAYRFRITNGASVQTIDRSTNSFYLTQLASYAYGTTYSIDVAVQYGGIWQPYGTACNIATPVAATVTTALASTSCGITVSANAQILEADKVVGATQYEFLVENVGLSYSQSVVNNTFTFNLAQLTGIGTSTTYTVKVRTKVNDTWSPYGAVCNVTSSGSGLRPGSESATEATLASSAFEAVAFPNPFSNGFGVSIKTSSDELISVTVYDMSGKVLDVKTVSANDLNTLRMGEGYAAGIYQVKVVQGIETKTLKIVKQ